MDSSGWRGVGFQMMLENCPQTPDTAPPPTFAAFITLRYWWDAVHRAMLGPCMSEHDRWSVMAAGVRLS